MSANGSSILLPRLVLALALAPPPTVVLLLAVLWLCAARDSEFLGGKGGNAEEADVAADAAVLSAYSPLPRAALNEEGGEAGFEAGGEDGEEEGRLECSYGGDTVPVGLAAVAARKE